MPRLVVAMPAYNAEATIRSAVLSTLRAMPEDSELFVCDDRSTDRTLDVLQTVKDLRLRVVTNEVNRGNGYVRRRLMEESDSDYIAAMDADDIAFPWRFAAQMRALVENDVVFGSVVRFGRSTTAGGSYLTGRRAPGWIRPSMPLRLAPDEFSSAILFHCPVFQSSLLARREALEKAGGYRPLRYGQDYEMFLRIGSSGVRATRIGLPVVAYRESHQQATRRNDYIPIIRRTEALTDAYRQLFNAKKCSVSLDTDSNDPVTALRKIGIGLRELLPTFRPVNRAYYARLLSSGRSPEWLAERFPAWGHVSNSKGLDEGLAADG